MNGKRIVLTLVCALWMIAAGAQNTVESIRKLYQEVQENIGLMMPGEDGMWGVPPQYYELDVHQNLPGTGLHNELYRMFYVDEEVLDEDGEPVIYPPHFLRFVTVKYNFAAREFYEECLFDDHGNVLFIYFITVDLDENMVPYELRLWYDGDRLLRFMAKRAEGGEAADLATMKKYTFKEEYSGKTIPEKFQEVAGGLKASARKFIDMFEAIDNRTYK